MQAPLYDKQEKRQFMWLSDGLLKNESGMIKNDPGVDWLMFTSLTRWKMQSNIPLFMTAWQYLDHVTGASPFVLKISFS